MKKGFFAYPSEPKYCGEAIEELIEKVNESFNGTTNLSSWVSLRVNGKLIISEILDAIDNCDYFCADLTSLNDNVLFELGYAITKKKPIWLVIDKSNENSNKKFKELGFFTTVGYSDYTNTSQLYNSFCEEEVYSSTNTLFDSIFASIDIEQSEKALFYIKSQIDTNYSQDIINEIERLKLPYTLDDPIETKVQQLTWYFEQIFSTPAMLVEFSSSHRSGYELHNTKCAFISGLALGNGLDLLMVAENPHPTPVDYRELLKKHDNRQECNKNVIPFLESVKDDIAELLIKKRERRVLQKERTNLQKIHFGEFIAEHESDNLGNYYIETAHYQNLIKSEHNIVIGRKGTGKTATFYHLEEELARDVRNHVCEIKPINFEIDGIISLNDQLKDEFEKGYMIESIWKFLIYTELAKTLYAKVKDKPLYSLSEEESNFISYVEANDKIILTDFSTRLEQEIEELINVQTDSQGEFRVKISEILHDGKITELRNHIKNNMRKGGMLVVLIDNLDKSWKKNKSIDVLSKYLLGLLGVVGRIAKDFKNFNKGKSNFSFHMTLFLRSDIFKYIMKSAREPDKIEFTRLVWNDASVLFRMVETRFEQLSNIDVSTSDLWEKFVTQKVDGIEVKDYIMNNIFPRPRDVIYLLNSAKNTAVSRGHVKIKSEDMITAHRDYSSWVFKSILVENGITIKQMEDFMYNLMGENQIITLDRISGLAEDAKIVFNENYSEDDFIDSLVSLTILGREVKESQFDFEYEFDSDIKLKSLANKLGSKRFMIHNALSPYLELIN